MSRKMGDSTTVSDIPTTVDICAIYANGIYAAHAADIAARFPAARYGWARIDVTGALADVADVLDVETGDASPGTANLWVQSWHKLGRHGLPVLYVNRANMSAVESACASGGSKLGVHYLLWVATLDGTQYTGPGVAACQWRGQAQTGGHWDESIVYDDALWLPASQPAKVTKSQAQTALATVGMYVGQQP